MKPVTFCATYDLMFDHRGITHIPSGSFNPLPMPGQARIIVRNVETTKVSADLDGAATKSANLGEKALMEFVQKNFAGKDERAKQALYHALFDCEDCE